MPSPMPQPNVSPTGFRKYLNNTLWLLFEKLLRIAAALLIGAWVARYLGPSQFGLLSFAQSLAALFASVASLGITNVLVRDLVQSHGPAHRQTLLSTALLLSTLGACLSRLALAVYLYCWGYGATTNTLVLVIGCAVLFQVSAVMECHFQSEVKARLIVRASISSLLLSSAVKLLLIYCQAPLLAFSAKPNRRLRSTSERRRRVGCD